ncbi:MAG: M56/M15 family metallopeptidase [Flavihumibacter sp.]
MVAFVLARILLVSGLLLGYYWLFLRNRRQHQFNRFFLLATALSSVLVVFVRFDWIGKGTVVSSGATTAGNDRRLGEQSVFAEPVNRVGLHWPAIVLVMYAIGCIIGIIRLWRSVTRLAAIKKAATPVQHGAFRLYLTDSPAAPAVFLSTLFWPRDMDPDGAFARQVLQHEQYHIRQKHGWDIALMEVICVAMWFNPFIHMVRKEIRLLHEFAADAFASEAGAELQYAEQLLAKRLAHKKANLAIPFSQPPLKRRIMMLLSQQALGYGNAAGWRCPLPRWFFVDDGSPAQQFVVVRKKAIRATIVVDAGHGGPDGGAYHDGVYEKDINLAIAKAIAEEAAAYNLNIVLTRNGDALPGGTIDITTSLRYRSDMGNNAGASLFLSIHVESAVDEHASVYISSRLKDPVLLAGSAAAGSAIAKSLNPVISTRQELRQRQEQGIWVLNNSAIPAVLVECGSMAQAADRAVLTDPAGPRKLARAILDGVQQYLAAQ